MWKISDHNSSQKILDHNAPSLREGREKWAHPPKCGPQVKKTPLINPRSGKFFLPFSKKLKEKSMANKTPLLIRKNLEGV